MRWLAVGVAQISTLIDPHESSCEPLRPRGSPLQPFLPTALILQAAQFPSPAAHLTSKTWCHRITQRSTSYSSTFARHSDRHFAHLTTRPHFVIRSTCSLHYRPMLSSNPVVIAHFSHPVPYLPTCSAHPCIFNHIRICVT